MQTKNGVELNLYESKYKSIFYGFTFYFSSMFYKSKFDKGLQNYIDVETQKLESKYRINIDFSIYLAISYYMKIEKRGFLIRNEENKPINKFIISTRIKFHL